LYQFVGVLRSGGELPLSNESVHFCKLFRRLIHP
jgi:hypothetical protein